MNLSLRSGIRSVYAAIVIGVGLVGAAAVPSFPRAQDAPPSNPDPSSPPQAQMPDAQTAPDGQAPDGQNPDGTPSVAPSGTSSEAAPAVPAPEAAAETPPPELTGTPAAICAKLAAKDTPGIEERDREAISKFYQGRACRPLWVDEQGPTRAASLAIKEIAQAADWGLDASGFDLKAAKQPITSGSWTPEETAAADLEITAAVLRYAYQAEGGRIPDPDKRLSAYLDRTPAITDPVTVLTRVSGAPDAGDALRAFQPTHDQFLKLKALLARMRAGPPPEMKRFEIPRRGELLLVGVRNPDVAILKQRFGIASAPGSEQLFDDALAGAIKKFQESKSLRPDGIVGSSTRAKLSGEDLKASPEKISAVLANMEEWRWMPRSLGDPHVFVNVPSFSIVLMENNKPVFNERVIVGKASTQTPIFSKEMTKIVLRPRWNLPDSIKATTLRAGRSLEGQGYVVMRNGRIINSSRINWGRAKLSEYTVYQPAGDDNALGSVKMLFPNKHSVYLHDTPSRSLFNSSVRLFSHGCMRVRNPQTLAQLVFNIDQKNQTPNVAHLVNKGPRDNQISLNKPIPVHVGYFTVWIGDDGSPQFFDDHYGHQKRITLALAGKWKDIDYTRERITPETADIAPTRKYRVSSRRGRDDGDDDDDAGRGSRGYASRRGEEGRSRGGMGLSRSGRSYSGGSTVGDMVRRSLGF